MKDREGSFQKLVLERRSIRSFSDTPVDREKIAACLEAARLAPSADNAQPWRFLVIDDPAVKSRFSKEVFSGIYGSLTAGYNPLLHRIGEKSGFWRTSR